MRKRPLRLTPNQTTRLERAFTKLGKAVIDVSDGTYYFDTNINRYDSTFLSCLSTADLELL